MEDEILIRVQRIQRKFQEDLPADKRMKYLQYLSSVRISLDILKETSIGKTINVMRKEDGLIGQMAGQLYSTWKELAASEYGTSSSSKQKTVTNNIKIKTEDDDDSYNQSNGTVVVKKEKEYTSSSSPCKPKQDEHDKLKKMKNNDSSKSSSSSSKRTESTWNVKVEPSYSGYEDYESSSKLNSEKSSKKSKLKDVERKIKQEEEDFDSHVENTDSVVEKKIKKEELSPVKDNTESEETTPKKKNAMSFEDMLMMPIFPTKKKKKKKTEAVKQKILDPPPKLPALPALPELDLPQINTVPVYRPSRLSSSLNFGEEAKKKAPEPAPSTISSADITSRKTKSVMYTGKKNLTGVVPSLHQMCMRILIENVDALYETGGVPFSVLEPLLSKVGPDQLERLEYYNPHFIQDTDKLWKRHCQIQFKCSKIDADSVGAWRDLYKELLLEREERLRRLSSKIVYNQTKKAPERSVKLAFVGTAPKASAQVERIQRKKERDRDMRKKSFEREKEDNQKEIRDRMMSEQKKSSDVVVPFTNVPRRDRCSKRPPSSLSSSNLHPEPKKSRPKEELGSVAPPEFTPAPKKKKAKNPMMMKTLKLLKKQKSRMSSQIMRK